MAAHDVFKAIAPQVDSEFLAMDVLPILWQFSLGPLLNLPQFQAYMTLIKSTSARVEQEQTRKLQELGANSTTATSRNEFMSFGGPPAANGFDSNGGDDTNFEALVRGGNQGPTSGSDMLGGDTWGNASANASALSSTILPTRPANRANNVSPAPAAFAWSTPPVSPPPPTNLSAPQGNSRAITPDNAFSSLNSSFPAMNPTNPGIGSPTLSQQQSRPAMGMDSMMSQPTTAPSYVAPSAGIDWSRANTSSTSGWGSSSTSNTVSSGLSNFSAMTPSQPQPPRQNHTSSPYSGFSIAPPPMKPANTGTFSIAPPPMLNATNRSASASGGMRGGSMNSMAALRAQTQSQQGQRQPSQTPTNWGSGSDSLI